MLRAEMGMIHMGYGHMAEDWERRAKTMEGLGHLTHAVFAWEKEEVWLEFAECAKKEFNVLVPGLIT